MSSPRYGFYGVLFVKGSIGLFCLGVFDLGASVFAGFQRALDLGGGGLPCVGLEFRVLFRPRMDDLSAACCSDEEITAASVL